MSCGYTPGVRHVPCRRHEGRLDSPVSLSPGTRIGSYEIVGLLGVGGMGEVYRATDTNLKRTVALKVLPALVAADPDRLARFKREAEVLAALNHPNIAAIYGLERSGVTTALVMELVEGPTLADRIARDAMPIAEVLPIARQIAEALEAAHEQGIVHRDLKPANIKVRPDDTVKVLDFGLAKAMGADPAPASNATMTSPAMTEMGMILGTAAYMSPEQAKGRRVDRRADVWAFGAVLYEMVTGTRAFAGDDVTEVLASVLAREPEWSLLPADAPAIANCIRRCLERDPKQRFGDMQSVRLALGGAFSPSTTSGGVLAPAPPARVRSATLAWAIAGVATIAAIVFAVMALYRPAPARDLVKTLIAPPERTTFDFDVTAGLPALSPNGRLLAFSARSADGRIQLWVRPLDSLDARPLEGTDGASFPFWAPDSQAIGYYHSGKGRLERVDLNGGAPVMIAKGGYVRGATWGPGGIVLFDTSEGGGRIMEASLSSSTTKTLIEGKGYNRSPWLLPDGRHFLYHNSQTRQIYVAARGGGTEKVVTNATSNAIYAEGRLIFMREDVLLAQPFELSRLELTGSPVAIARGVQTLLGDIRGVFSVSETGLLLYLDGAAGSATQLVWFDGAGKRVAMVGELGSIRGVRLSPDGLFAMIGVIDVEGRLDLWRLDLASGRRTRVTFAAEPGDVPSFMAWSPDSSAIAYSAKKGAGMAIVSRPAAGGAEETLFTLPADQATISNPRVTVWSGDGTLVYSGSSLGGIWIVPPGPPGARKAAPLVQDYQAAQNARLSPNQRWFAYQAAPRDGPVQTIFVEAFPGGGKRQQVSARGTLPVWGADGKTLYYADDNMLTGVDVAEVDGVLRFGTSRAVMPIIVGRGFSYDVATGGRILALVTPEWRAARPLTLVQGWAAALKER